MSAFYCIERPNADPYRNGRALFATYPIGAILWRCAAPGSSWTDRIDEARKFESRGEAQAALIAEGWHHDLGAGIVVTEHVQVIA